jgi:hypothetical protein
MIKKIKWIAIGIVTVILIALGIIVAIQNAKINSLTEDLLNSKTNEKALLLLNDSNKNEVRSLKLTVEQLEYFNDSILIKLNNARKELKIKNESIQELQYLKTLVSKKDTVILKDTIFVEAVNVDTTIQDKWHKTNLQLKYPNEIIVTPEFVSEKAIITSIKKETVNPPKKCKFARWFQKKHKVLVVDIQEKNPYVTTQEYKHIEIIK